MEFEYYKGEAPKLEKGKKFFDRSFEYNNDETIFGKNKSWDEEKIKKISEFKESHGYERNETIKWTRIFENEVIPYNDNKEGKLDLKQGNLGNCGIISFIHCLKREFTDHIFSSIISKCEPVEGYFEVLFYFKEGNNIIKKKVFVDDFIPYKKIPNSYRSLCNIPNNVQYMPLFSKLGNYMVGQYLLIEKAFAKVRGSYMDITGKDIAFELTGVPPQSEFLFDILKERIEKKGLSIDESLGDLIKKELRKLEFYKDEEIISKIRIEKYITKNLIIKNNILEQFDKDEIFNKIKNISEKNLLTVGSDDLKMIQPKTHFGISKS